VLRAMLNMAARENVEVSIPSFDGLIERKSRDRILAEEEEAALMKFYPTWMKRIAVVARETALNQGDTIELTKEMIDRKNRLIVLPDGRSKTHVDQSPYLTDVVIQILDDIERDKRDGTIVSNTQGLVFTRDDGRKITKDMVTGAVKRACYRHMAQTNWAIEDVSGPIAMKMAGLKSAQMLQRYQNIKPRHVSEYMSRLKNGNTNGEQDGSQDSKERATS
jgi:hypothetical protein